MNVVETVITAAGLVVGLVLLWTWRRGLEVSSFQATLLSVIEVAGFVIAVATLGWLGVAILLAVSLVATIVWSIVLAIKKQSILIGAAVQGSDLTKEEAEEVWHWMGAEKSFAGLPPLKRAELIKALALKTRGAEEICAMATPIAQLSLVFECDPLWLAPRFDQLLRLYGHDAAEAGEVADTVSASTQNAPISFEEMVEAMLIAGGTGPAEVAPDEGPDHHFLEDVRVAAELQIREDGEKGVRLNGGPMDGWLVLEDAPTLAPAWHKTWPPDMTSGTSKAATSWLTAVPGLSGARR